MKRIGSIWQESLAMAEGEIKILVAALRAIDERADSMLYGYLIDNGDESLELAAKDITTLRDMARVAIIKVTP